MIDTAIRVLAYTDPAFCVLALLLLWRSGELRAYGSLAILLSVRALLALAMLYCFSMLDQQHPDLRSTAYWAYYVLYWSEAALEAVISLHLILKLFQLAMKPLKGLQKLGSLVFRWASFVSLGLAVALGARPSLRGLDLLNSIVLQFNAVSSILILGLLLFVCFAIRPLGLSFRSRPFGISLGLGVHAAISLVQNSWASQIALSSWGNVLLCGSGLTSLLIWSAYFYFPEVRPRILMLPTTSPYLVWNEISEALGDEPGYVAVAGIAPDVFAPAEMEIMFRASAMMDALGPGGAEKPAARQALSA